MQFHTILQKNLLVNILISDHHTDLLCLTETFLDHDEYVNINEATPTSHINTFLELLAEVGAYQLFFILIL